ncbi:MAG TPA: DUF2202 domain-containing protein [Ignavibacteriaceae bacterium]|nr:DUF2202 domain-containing protein [Ignavibacteriaceae bacterium]
MRYLLNTSVLVLSSLILYSCSNQPTTPDYVQDELNKNLISTTVEISPEEIEGLIYMRQEEKIIRDVYTVLGETWNSNVFIKIMSAEQKHMDAVKTLLTRYGIEDPVTNDEVGFFANPEFQQMFNEFVQQGQLSLTEAYLVGKTIEEQDIAALENQLSFVDNPDIINVYTNLKSASEKHLIVFINHIGQSF